MITKKSNSSEQNFWIAYADLMAGLLFVFILVLGAIVIKYVFIQENLDSTKINLEKQLEDLEISKRELSKKQILLLTFKDRLEAARREINLLKQINKNYETDLTNLIGDSDLAKEILLKKDEIIVLKETEIEKLLSSLNLAMAENQKIAYDLNITKSRINNLTGIRIHVIKELKKKFGNNIKIDQKTGSIQLPSSVLFDTASYELKDDAKSTLKDTLTGYFDVLIGDEEIRNNIDKITIEGHTDSDGSYLYNLDLSQKRAYAVMNFIYSLKRKDSELLKDYLTASGRSFNDVILINGNEDKEASRRIEIKFNISNKKAIEEIQTFLENEYK